MNIQTRFEAYNPSWTKFFGVISASILGTYANSSALNSGLIDHKKGLLLSFVVYCLL